MAKTQKTDAQKTKSSKSPARVQDPHRVIKRVNTRLLTITFGIFVVLVPMVYFVHGWQVEGNADKLKERAEAAEAAGDYDKALPLYAQYLNFRDSDLDALLHYLRLRDGLVTNREALSRVLLGYEEVLRRDPNRPDEAEIRQDIIALAMALGDYSLAVHHLETLLKDEELPELQFQLAQCRQGEGRFKEAVKGYGEVLEAEPGQPKYYVPLAFLFANQASNLPERPSPPDDNAEDDNAEDKAADGPKSLSKKIEALLPVKYQRDYSGASAADQILQWMVDEAQTPAEAYLVRANFRHQQKRLEDAREDVESARALDASNPSLLLFSAQLAVEQARSARLRGQWNRYSPWVRLARQDAAQGRADNPLDARFPLLRAMIEEESREGLRLLPAVADKPGSPRPVAQKLENSLKQAQWEVHETIEETLREGLDVVGEALADLKNQKPLRTSLRIQEKHSPLNRSQLSQIAIQLRWSLADSLISKHLLAAGDPSHKKPPRNSPESLKEEVSEHLEALRKTGADTGLVEFLEARLLAAEGDWKEAAWTLEQARLRLAGQTAIVQRIDLLLDQCYGQMGNPDQQLQVAQRALRETPGWLPALVRLPGLYQSANRPDDALKAYQRIQNFPGVSLAVARLRLQKELNKPAPSRRWDAIHAALDSAKPHSLENPASLSSLRADVLSLEAAQLAERGDREQSHEKYRQALKVLETALESTPDSPELWAARGLLELKLPFPAGRTPEERIQAAAGIVEKAILEHGDRLPLRLAAVQLATLLPTSDAIRELQALEKPPFPPEEQPEFLEGLARAQALVGFQAAEQTDKDAALKRVLSFRKQAAALKAREIAPQIGLGELAFGQKDAATIQTAIDRVTKIEGPNGPNGNYLKALHLFVNLKRDDAKNIDRARRLLTLAMKDRPFWAALPRTLGDLEWKLENHEVGITHYEKAFELGERTREMVTSMVQYYTTHQRLEYADEFLRKVALDTPILLSGDLARWKWRVDWQMKRHQEALGLASDLAARSNDYQDHLWESRLRFSRGERGDSVLEPLLKARDLAPDQPEPWVVLISYYVQTGKTKEAQAALAEAQKPENLASDPPHRRSLTLGQCYELLNDPARAEQQYLAALRAAKSESLQERQSLQMTLADFYSRARGIDADQQQHYLNQAQKHLDLLLDSQQDVPPATIEWARLRKALLAASSGRYDDTQKALALLAKGRDGETQSDAALRAEAKILQIRGRYQDRLALIGVLETLNSRNALTADEKLFLARTYEGTNQWPKAQAVFQELKEQLAGESTTVRAKLLADYALALLNRKDIEEKKLLAEGEALVKELERLEPKSFRATTSRAMLLYRQGRGNEAALALESYIQTLDVQTPEQAFRDLVEQQKIEEALQGLQTLLDAESAGMIIERVRQLIAQGDEAEAVAVLKRYIAVSDLVANVQTALIRVIARFLEELEQYAAAEKTYRHYAKRATQPEAVLEVAAFLGRRNRIDEALALCDAAWKTSDPRLVGKVSVGTLRTAGKPTPAQIQRVETHLAEAVENADPEHWLQLVTTFADLRDLQGRHQESINIYREMLKRNPRNVTALNNLAWLLSYQSQAHAEAQKLIEQAISLYGPVGALLDTRGMIHLRRGQPAKALKDLKQAVEEMPVAAIYFHLAQAHLAAGNKQAAEAAFRDAQAKNLDPITDLHVLEAGEYHRIVEVFK